MVTVNCQLKKKEKKKGKKKKPIEFLRYMGVKKLTYGLLYIYNAGAPVHGMKICLVVLLKIY